MDLDAVRKLIESISAPVICYFYYNPVNGQVIKITNCFEEDEFPYIEIPAVEVDTNLSINDYQIVRKDEKFELVKKDKFIDNVPKIDDNIHQIFKRIADPKIKISQVNYSFDMLIEQDNVKKEFRIRVSGVIKDQYYQTSNSTQKLFCYVTAENDPNLLYKTLDIPLAKVLQYHYYTLPYEEYDGTPCNIFSMRYFHNYLHLVIE